MCLFRDFVEKCCGEIFYLINFSKVSFSSRFFKNFNKNNSFDEIKMCLLKVQK